MADAPETRVAVIYYSATGNVHGLARAVAEGAEQAAATVRLCHVEELASELEISQSQHWGRHRSQVDEEPVATVEDLDWADGIAFGTPTRFGNVSAQLKQFMDRAGRLWQQGKLAEACRRRPLSAVRAPALPPPSARPSASPRDGRRESADRSRSRVRTFPLSAALRPVRRPRAALGDLLRAPRRARLGPGRRR